MAEKPRRVVCVGEVMVELAHGADGRYGLAYGGDTFNTAVYLARAGVPVAYGTALGDDPYSDGIAALAAAEGVGTDLVLRLPGRMPGLYLIETDQAGERQFYYWRETSPARELFELPQWSVIADGLLTGSADSTRPPSFVSPLSEGSVAQRLAFLPVSSFIAPP